MDKKKLIKTLINVLPIVIVPLVTERKRIKEHPDVQKVTDTTSKATSKTTSVISNKVSDVKEYVGYKKQEFDNKREFKKFLKKMILPILRKKVKSELNKIVKKLIK